jgi:hypothetical protein
LLLQHQEQAIQNLKKEQFIVRGAGGGTAVSIVSESCRLLIVVVLIVSGPYQL